MAFQGMFPGNNKFDVADALGGFIEHRAQALKKKNVKESLIKSGVDQSLAGIWDELDTAGKKHALENRGWGEVEQSIQRQQQGNNNQYNQQQNNIGEQLPSHPSQYNTGTRAGDIAAYQEDRKRLAKQNFEEQQATKAEYAKIQGDEKILSSTHKLLAQQGSASNVKRGKALAGLIGEAGQPVNAALLDQKKAEWIANDPTGQRAKLADSLFPSPYDSPEARKAKLDNLQKMGKEAKKLIISRNNIVKANGGEVPEGLDQILEEVALKNEAQMVQADQNIEDENALTPEEQQRYASNQSDDNETTPIERFGKNVAGGLIEGAKAPANIANIGKGVQEANKGNLYGQILGALQKTSEMIHPELKALKHTGHAIKTAMDNIDPNEYLKPKTQWDQNAQDVVSAFSSGLLATGGANAWSLFKNSVIAKTGRQLAKSGTKAAGAPEGVQNIAGFVADVLTPVWYNTFNVNNVIEKIKPELEKDFKTIIKHGPKTVNIKDFKKPLSDIEERIRTSSNKSKYQDILAGIEAEANTGKVSLQKLYDIKQDLGEGIFDKRLKHLQPLWAEAKKKLSEVKVPGHQATYDKIDAAYSAIHDVEETRTFLEKFTKIKGLGLNAGANTAIKAFHGLINNSGTEATTLLRKLNKTDQAKVLNYFADMGKAATEHRIADFANSASKIGKL